MSIKTSRKPINVLVEEIEYLAEIIGYHITEISVSNKLLEIMLNGKFNNNINLCIKYDLETNQFVSFHKLIYGFKYIQPITNPEIKRVMNSLEEAIRRWADA